MIYLSADHHFNHDNIINISNRPFNNREQMNKFMIEAWNKVVKTNDTIFYLGDFGFGKRDNLKEICSCLNGQKILILGNHDKKQGYSALKFIGFVEIFDTVMLDKVLLTHKPVIEIGKGQVNVHGHIHNSDISKIKGYSTKDHLCVSVECTNYTPVSIDFIKKRFKGMLH